MVSLARAFTTHRGTATDRPESVSLWSGRRTRTGLMLERFSTGRGQRAHGPEGCGIVVRSARTGIDDPGTRSQPWFLRQGVVVPHATRSRLSDVVVRLGIQSGLMSYALRLVYT